jgi:hypothetical protein
MVPRPSVVGPAARPRLARLRFGAMRALFFVLSAKGFAFKGKFRFPPAGGSPASLAKP